MDAPAAIDLLRGLVSIPSLSEHEAEAATWLSAQMAGAGFDRAYVDEAGNAVGEMGPTDAGRIVVLLGHIDTVPGGIEVRVEDTPDGSVLYGRGSVDAKGPLASCVAAVSRVGSTFATEGAIRLIVVGAVEEESASSKGARFIRSRFDGTAEPIPDACIIGEPSRWNRMTLGYKGRLLVDLGATRAMTHTAGPEAGITTVATDLWALVESFAASHNEGLDKAFAQLLPSLRSIVTQSDGLEESVTAHIGLRLSPEFDPAPLVEAIQAWAAARSESTPPPAPTLEPGNAADTTLDGDHLSIHLDYRGYEPAWRSDNRNPLVRSFLAAIRTVAPEGTRPSFLVKTGTSDMNVVGPAWQCPILAYGPGDSALDHTPNEHVSLDEYTRAIEVLTQALRNYAATP